MTTLKKEIEDILHPNKEELHPPRAPIMNDKQKDAISGETPNTSSKGGGSIPQHPTNTYARPIIDFYAMAQASEFQRFIYWIRTGKVFRGSNKELEKDLLNTQKDMEMVQELKKIDPNAHNFGNVINEFKAKVERLKKRNE